ncbi:MAG: hypothetical protein R2845_13825 [Thermomicrobiales bacterium]
MTGEGFYRNETVTIYWDSTGSTGRVLTTTSANAFGEISVNVSIPILRRVRTISSAREANRRFRHPAPTPSPVRQPVRVNLAFRSR